MIRRNVLDGVVVTEVHIQNIRSFLLEKKKGAHKDIGHFLSANYGSVNIQSIPNIHYALPAPQYDEFMELREINGFFYISDRALIKYWGLKRNRNTIPSLLKRKVNDLFDFLIRDNSYYFDTIQDNRDQVPPFQHEIQEETIFSIGDLGSLRELGVYYPDNILFNGGFFILDHKEDDTDFTAIGDAAGLYSIDGVIQSPAMYKRPALMVFHEKWAIELVGTENMLIHLPNGTVLSMDDDMSQEICVLTRSALNAKETPINHEREEIAFAKTVPVCYKAGGGSPFLMVDLSYLLSKIHIRN